MYLVKKYLIEGNKTTGYKNKSEALKDFYKTCKAIDDLEDVEIIYQGTSGHETQIDNSQDFLFRKFQGNLI